MPASDASDDPAERRSLLADAQPVSDDEFKQRVICGAMVGLASSMSYGAYSSSWMLCTSAIAAGSVLAAIAVLTSRRALASFPTVFKVAALTAVVINIFDFLLASPAALKEYPELLSKGGSGVRAACFVGGLVIAAMPSTTLRWRLTLTAQLSLVKLIPAAILAYRMRDDGLIFAVFYYADRMTFLLGFCGMLTITNYTSGLSKQLAESDRRVAELEEARRDSIAREFFARHSPGVALDALAVPSRASDYSGSESLEEEIPGAGFYSAAGTAANWSPTSHHTAKCSPGAQFSPMAQRW